MSPTRFTSAVLALLFLAAPAFAQTRQAVDDGNNVIQNALRQGATNAYQLNSVSNLLRPLSASAKVIDIVCTTACHVSQGSSPATATATSFLLPANIIRRLKVNGIATDSIAVIADTTAGTFFVVEMN